MKVAQIEFSKSVKISYNYNSVSAQYGMVVNLDENDDPEEIAKLVAEKVTSLVKFEVRKELRSLIDDKLLSK